MAINPMIVELSSLNGTNGFRLDGAASSDQSGRVVSDLGDINGDGFDDFIVGAAQADPNGSNSGTSYVVFGKAAGLATNMSLSSIDGTNGFRINGVLSGDRSGISVAGAGDINGDGIDDIIVGAYGSDPTGSYSGSSYVVFGKATGFGASLNLSTLNGSNGFRIDGVAIRDYSGFSVSSAGDFNGDGFDDLLIGAYRADINGSDSGGSYVVFGKSSGFTSSMNL